MWHKKISGELDQYILNLQSSVADLEKEQSLANTDEQNLLVSLNTAKVRIKTSEEDLNSMCPSFIFF